jgi:hypothetical protein
MRRERAKMAGTCVIADGKFQPSGISGKPGKSQAGSQSVTGIQVGPGLRPLRPNENFVDVR